MEKEIRGFCAITEVNNLDFYICKTAISSFILYNSWFSGTLVLINTGDELTNHNKNILKLIYSKIDIIYPDDSKILTKLRKKKSTSKRSNFLFTHAFKIKSEGNIFFSKTNLFMGEISSILTKESASIPISSSTFPDLDCSKEKDLNHNLMFIPKKYISEKNYNLIQNTVINATTLHSVSGESDVIKSFINLSSIKVEYHPNTMIVNSSVFANNKYSKFIRYHKAILSLNMNTYSQSGTFNYKRIHNYWKQYNHNLTKGINNSPVKRVPKNITIPRKSKMGKSRTSIYPTNMSNKKLAICTICNDSFIKGAQVMIHSLINHNKWFNGDIVVMYSNSLSPLSEESKKCLSDIYDNVVFREINEKDYSKAIDRFVNKNGLHRNFMPSLFTFEVFSIEGYDELLYVDADILHNNSIVNMVKTSGDFIVTPTSFKYPTEIDGQFSGGVFMIRGNMISKKIKEDLIRFSIMTNRFGLLDQTIMNDFFRNKPKTWVSNRYNCSKRCFPDQKFNDFDNDISIIHYVAQKPWNKKTKPTEKVYGKLEQLWIDYYDNYIVNKNKEEEKNILVIGNSPSIKEHILGDKIDEFDVVIRVNDFRTIGFEKYVGTKTSKVITTFATNFKTKEYDYISSDKIMMSLFDQRLNTKYLNKRIEKYSLNTVNILPKYYYLGLNKDVGIDGINKRCSSGTIALSWAINQYPKENIYIHGIDLNSESGHYFKKDGKNIDVWKRSVKQYHNFDQEKKYINDLLDAKVIRSLKTEII